MRAAWQDHIESTPEVLHGRPRIKGTRIPVSLVLGYLAEGYGLEEIIAEFPDLNKEQIAACLNLYGDKNFASQNASEAIS